MVSRNPGNVIVACLAAVAGDAESRSTRYEIGNHFRRDLVEAPCSAADKQRIRN
jgi:hypothetical protein